MCLSKKDPYQSEHLSKVVYNFVCASCNASYVGQTCQHLITRIDEHFGRDKKSYIYQPLLSPKDGLDNCSKDCFSVLVTGNTKHILIHHMAEAHLKKTKAISIHYITFFLVLFILFFFPTHLILLFD